MCVVVHRIDAPLVACTVVMSVDDTVKKRVTEEHVRMSHVDLSTKNLLTLSIFAVAHTAEELKILLYAAVTVWALSTRHLHCTTTCTDLLLCLVVYICETLLNELLSPLVKLVEIV